MHNEHGSNKGQTTGQTKVQERRIGEDGRGAEEEKMTGARRRRKGQEKRQDKRGVGSKKTRAGEKAR